MRIALTGASGQLGRALQRVLGATHELVLLNHDTLELSKPTAVETIVQTHAELVLHSAAYTNVDGCARDPALAYLVNGVGTHYVALACQHLNVPMVYFSTNEVFAGNQRQPYLEYDPPAPINAYGRSKAAGEAAVRELLTRFYIVRVAWLFGGERNFVRTVLRLAQANPQGEIRMVADEIGSPTYTDDVAEAVLKLIEMPFYGTYHLVNEGSCSRYELAQEILRRGGYPNVRLTPIMLCDYQRDSTPPPCSVLANIAGAALGLQLRSWQEALYDFMHRLQMSSVTPMAQPSQL